MTNRAPNRTRAGRSPPVLRHRGQGSRAQRRDPHRHREVPPAAVRRAGPPAVPRTGARAHLAGDPLLPAHRARASCSTPRRGRRTPYIRLQQGARGRSTVRTAALPQRRDVDRTALQLLSLYAVELVPPTAPTSFASTTSAWETLPDDLRARLDGLHVDARSRRDLPSGEAPTTMCSCRPSRRRSRTSRRSRDRHPRTGATMLFASQMMTKRIVELPPEESEALLEEVFTHRLRPAEHPRGIRGPRVTWCSRTTSRCSTPVRT